jgi:hypothetical protein
MAITIETRPLRVPNEDDSGGGRRSQLVPAHVAARGNGGGSEQSSDRPFGLPLGALGPVVRMVASTALRNLVLITLAILLILVLLPAALSAPWASAG